MSTPTSRTLQHLRQLGYVADVVERWVGGGKFRVRKDYLGGIDIIACGPDDTLFIQCTSGGNVSARVAKLRAIPEIVALDKTASRRVEVWGWAKRGPRGSRKVWTLRRVRLCSEDDDHENL